MRASCLSLYKESKQKAPQEGVVFALKYIFTDISKQDTSLHKEYLYDSYKSLFNNWIDDVYKSVAFSYFAEEPSWSSLYNTYEMIKYDVDRTLRNKKDSLIFQWVTEEKIRDFRNAANNVFSEGSPRHSLAFYLFKKDIEGKPQSFRNYKEQKRDAPEPLISLAYASILIKCLFKRWYELKLLEFKLCYFANVAEYLQKHISYTVN
jgi:hypothetical protein